MIKVGEIAVLCQFWGGVKDFWQSACAAGQHPIKLCSHRSDYMPQVTFIYPDEERNKWDLYRNHATKERQDKTIPETGDYLEKR